MASAKGKQGDVTPAPRFTSGSRGAAAGPLFGLPLLAQITSTLRLARSCLFAAGPGAACSAAGALLLEPLWPVASAQRVSP